MSRQFLGSTFAVRSTSNKQLRERELIVKVKLQFLILALIRFNVFLVKLMSTIVVNAAELSVAEFLSLIQEGAKIY